jgi:hypothetical protein
MKRLLFLTALLFFLAGPAFSFDFGLLLDQRIQPEQEVEAKEASFSYTPRLSPWFSWNGGRGLSLYVSGILSFEYHQYGDDRDGNDGWNKPALLPELSCLALIWRSGQDFVVEAGRISYTDAIGFAASGLFDGLRVGADLPSGRLTAGLWYTGLLYKETAEIMMTAADVERYAEPWKLDTPDAYFAPRRLLASFRWDMPWGKIDNLSLELLTQFDLNGNDEALHSQYGELQAEFFPSSKLGLAAGFLFETMEHSSGSFTAALGTMARLKTDIPGSLNDGLTLTIKFSSGQWSDSFAAFTPLNAPAQGMIFSKPLSGLALISVDYTARLRQTVLAESAIRYFFRTFSGEAGEPEGNAYGAELWTSHAWQPLDDLRLSLGGGLFLPSLGNIYPADNGAAWKITAGLTLAL